MIRKRVGGYDFALFSSNNNIVYQGDNGNSTKSRAYSIELGDLIDDKLIIKKTTGNKNTFLLPPNSTIPLNESQRAYLETLILRE